MRSLKQWLVALAAVTCALTQLDGAARPQGAPAKQPADDLPRGARLRLKMANPKFFLSGDLAASIAFSADGTRVAKAQNGQDGCWITVWDVGTGRELRTLHEKGSYIYGIAFCAEGRQLISAVDRTVILWDFATGESLYTHAMEVRAPSGAGYLIHAPDGRTAACPLVRKVEGRNRAIELVEVVSGRRRAELGDLPEAFGARREGRFIAHAFSPDGRLLACSFGEWDMGVHLGLWDVATGKRVRQLDKVVPSAGGVAFSPDGDRLAVAGANYSRENGKPVLYALYDPHTSKELQRVRGGDRGESHIAFSSDGRLLATAYRDEARVRLWEAATGELVCTLDAGLKTGGGALVFSPDGKTLASSHGGLAMLWDLDSLPEVKKVKPPKRLDDRPKPPAEAELSKEKVEAMWADLAADDAAKAYQAMWGLALHPKSSLPLLRDRLKPAAAPKTEHVAKLVADLNSDDFNTRQKAASELETFGPVVAPELRQALKDTDSAQVRRSLEEILKTLRPPIRDGALLRRLRAVEALEHIGSAEARAVLKDLAKGAPAALETQAAKETLDRLEKRAAAGP